MDERTRQDAGRTARLLPGAAAVLRMGMGGIPIQRLSEAELEASKAKAAYDDATVLVGCPPPAIDIEKYVKVEGYVPAVQMICETLGKPLSMTFDYEEGITVSHLFTFYVSGSDVPLREYRSHPP